MPSRQNKLRTRSPDRQRSWGTRYDTLVSPPPQEKPPVPSSPAVDASLPPGDAAAQSGLAHTPTVDLFDALGRPSERRDWADDEVPFTLSPHPHTVPSTTGGTPKPERLPHSASVFVGSLPPDANEEEVAQPLREHLSAYASIREVKIIRDSKGGLCAFVQCESPAQAVQLVSQAQANPRPFMNRVLRFESAKARRTLLVSYKIPKQFIPCASADDNSSDVTIDGTGVKGRWVQTEVPDSLRIWKPPQVRYPIVTYREDARRSRDRSCHESLAVVSNRGQAFTPDGLYFPKLKFDAQTVQMMAEAFGPLEYFKVFAPTTTEQKGREAIPLEHRARRSIDMDPAVWEVKWGHRDDSISAFNTMKSMPHLSVSWARESSAAGPRGDFNRSPAPLNTLTIPSHLGSTSPSFSGRRPLLLMDSQKSDGAGGGSPSFVGDLAASTLKRHDDTDDGWTLVRSQSHGTSSVVLPTVNDEGVDPLALTDKSQRSPEWKDGDFPPLDSSLKRMNLRNDNLDDANSIRLYQQVIGESEKIAFPSSTSGIAASVDDEYVPSIREAEKYVENAVSMRSRATHRRSLSNPIGRPAQAEVTKQSTMHSHYTPASQNIEIPPTPDLTSHSMADTPTSMHLEPPTPVNADMTMSQPLSNYKMSGTSPSAEVNKAERDHFRRPTVDTKAIFVGGLEISGPDAWNEGRLRAVFGKYGQIIEVRLMIPNECSKKTAFAFITFADEEGPAKSVRYEHNKTYFQRPIRVQMRDMYSPRGGGGFRTRGRGQGRRSNYEPRMFADFQRQQGPLPASNNPASIDGNATADLPATFNFGSAHLHPANLMLGHNNVAHSHPSQSNSTTSSEPYSHFSNNASSRPDGFFHREADNKTTVSLTPPPSQHGASYPSSAEAQAGPLTPISALPSHQPMGFSSPHGWPTAYTASFGYPMPYGAYGGVIPHGVMPMVPMHANSSQVSESSASPSTAMPSWGSIAPYPYVPYQYFVVPTPQAVNPTVPSSAPSQTSSPEKNHSQPPLVPTQLIQGEHGALIPIYHPQALNDYMSSSSPIYGMPEQRLTTSTSSGQSQGAQTYGASHTWSGAPPPVLAIQIPTQQVNSSQPLTPSHVQPPSHATNVTGSIRGSLPASNSASSIAHHERQRSIPQLPTSQTAPMHGFSVPTHNSLNSMPASGHPSLSKMPTSFSHQSFDTTRSNASHDHQRRRDSFSFGKPGSNGGQPGRPPSAVRLGQRVSSGPMNTSHSEHSMGGFALQQYVPQSQAQARPSLPNLQIGFSNVSNTDIYPQMHWIANHPQQHQQ